MTDSPKKPDPKASDTVSVWNGAGREFRVSRARSATLVARGFSDTAPKR